MRLLLAKLENHNVDLVEFVLDGIHKANTLTNVVILSENSYVREWCKRHDIKVTISDLIFKQRGKMLGKCVVHPVDMIARFQCDRPTIFRDRIIEECKMRKTTCFDVISRFEVHKYKDGKISKWKYGTSKFWNDYFKERGLGK